MTTSESTLLPDIEKTCYNFNYDKISNERKVVLQPLIDFIQKKTEHKQQINITFICTHNSRRSHLSQVWAQTAAEYYNVQKVFCYSGGTEATAMFPLIAETLANQGFCVETISAGTNPIYIIKYNHVDHPIIGFSKSYDHHFNPKNKFAAIMTCSNADGGCPFIAGAEERVAITFEDPKAFDNTPQQAQKYAERSLQIGAEMFYVFSKILQ